MILTKKKRLIVSQIAVYWAPELNRPADLVQLMIEEAIWRGDFPRLSPRRRAWVHDTEWFAPYPPDYYCSEDAMAPVYEFYAENWPGVHEITETLAPNPLRDLVLSRAELHSMAKTRRLPLPKFWGEASSDTESTAPATTGSSPIGGPQEPTAQVIIRRYGPRPVLRLRVVNDMRTDITAGKFTAEQLRSMKHEALAAQYDTKRTTAVEALCEVLLGILPEFRGNDKLRQTPTSDK